jgi:hypothetical protein
MGRSEGLLTFSKHLDHQVIIGDLLLELSARYHVSRRRVEEYAWPVVQFGKIIRENTIHPVQNGDGQHGPFHQTTAGTSTSLLKRPEADPGRHV